jgi:hypothetical protein
VVSKEARHLWVLRSTREQIKVAKKSTRYHERRRTAPRAALPQGEDTEKTVQDSLWRRCVRSACGRGRKLPENRTGPVSRARLLIPYPAGSQLRSSGRLGSPLLRAVTGTLHVLLSSPGISQSPTPNGPPAELRRFPGSGLRNGRNGPFRSPRFVMAGRSSRVCSATWSQFHCRASLPKVPAHAPEGGGDLGMHRP